MNKLSKAEKKKRANKKREKIALEIWDVIVKTFNETNDWEAALGAGDAHTGRLVRQTPQDKTLIEQSAYLLMGKIEDYMKEHR